HLAAEKIDEDSQAAKKDRQPQVKVLEDARKHLPVVFKVDDGAAVFALQDAGFELQIPSAAAVEVHHVAADRLVVKVFAEHGSPAPLRSRGSMTIRAEVLDRLPGALQNVFLGVTLADRLEHSRRGDIRGPPASADLHFETMAKEDHGREQRQQINPEAALG